MEQDNEAPGTNRFATFAAFPPLPDGDWLLDPTPYKAELQRGEREDEIALSNGLIRRTFRLAPNAATIAYDNLMSGVSMLRGVKPEATIQVDGQGWALGGLRGQEEYAYLRPEWVDAFSADEAAFQYCGLATGKPRAHLDWRRGRHAPELPWPPPGVALSLRFRAPEGALCGLEAEVHYELYDGIPLLCKWLVLRNGCARRVRLNGFVSEILAVVEREVAVDELEHWNHPDMHVESDFAFHGMTPGGACKTTHWVPDPQYTTQVNYQLQTPCLLESRLPLGPEVDIEAGEEFVSFRTCELVYDNDERERRGLALRRLYRTIAPWTQENPLLMHVRQADPEAVRRAVDQCAEVGFEMVIMSFGSGFEAENEAPDYIDQIKELADYAHARGIELGGYSLLASRSAGAAHDVLDAQTGAPGQAIFGNSPCLCSAWGGDYFRKLKALFEQTGLDVLEHDGSYPGDVCASGEHPDHEGLADSQWRQWQRITGFYHWCRGRGIYLNVPDWYFLSGSSKTGMGYREVNWSLPRQRQILLARQNIYDGTWEKTPSMGWMFVPLVEYQGGGAAATLEPLAEHLEEYAAHLAQNLGSGVQACYRGHQLYDGAETRKVVEYWVGFYKKYRAILESDVVHLRRPDGRDIDGLLHVNPQLETRGLAMLYNPLAEEVVRRLRLPLYYTGLRTRARIREREGEKKLYELDRHYQVELELRLAAKGATWLVIEAEESAG